MKNVNDVWTAAEARLAAGDAPYLGDLGVALAERLAGNERVWQYRSVFDRLLRLLAVTPGSGNLVQALRLVFAARAGGRNLERYAASQLATGHAPRRTSSPQCSSARAHPWALPKSFAHASSTSSFCVRVAVL